MIVWNKSLDFVEIKKLYEGFNFTTNQTNSSNSTLPALLADSDLRVHLKFENNLLDSSNNSNNATGSGTMLWGTGHDAGYAVVFDGNTTRYATLNDMALSIPHGTYSVWIKPSTFDFGSYFGTIFDKTKSGVSNYLRVVVVSVSTQGGYVGHEKEIEVRLGDNVFYSGVDLDTNWHHIVVTWDGTEQRIYLDNLRVNVLTSNRNPTSSSSSSYNNFIGVSGDGNSNANFNFQGSMDEMSIWQRALNETEIDELYHSGIRYN